MVIFHCYVSSPEGNGKTPSFLEPLPTIHPPGEAKLVAKAVRKLGLALCERDRPQEAARSASEAVVFCKKVQRGQRKTIGRPWENHRKTMGK